ncbi:SEC-C metal-binding domain-containing protein [Vibrio sp. SCSIO 43136]|uniref:YecA/YgfB family protein n=1 Tax=Vibrio sp. SCSIO 43136 TaxID=2819101 RepID=UPI002075F684|nr:SEC-C metal-binding domain-containing protein [Vibrio sp. SCSIO 43136]USD64431.1 SEC-C domain-containing protein [Vibrio sp. SCSIO 43136]
MYQILTSQEQWSFESAEFLEGAVLAANFAAKPLKVETWLEPMAQSMDKELIQAVEQQIHAQYAALKTGDYSLLALVGEDRDKLADLAEGFMQVWPTIEEQWQEFSISDGTLRMLQALLTTFMLSIDQEQTHEQMRQAGMEELPQLEDLVGQIDLMVNEVALAGDELMSGAQAQSVNPYKDIGRNDPCPCESGKKFKQCCGK